jgi:hypothetical protein
MWPELATIMKARAWERANFMITGSFGVYAATTACDHETARETGGEVSAGAGEA